MISRFWKYWNLQKWLLIVKMYSRWREGDPGAQYGGEVWAHCSGSREVGGRHAYPAGRREL